MDNVDNQNNEIDNNENINILVQCPHCNDLILIEKLNCCIFRHGTIKTNGKQIDSHASKQICENYINKSLIYGCGKPFKIIINEKSTNNDDKYTTVICDYI